FFSSRRRHTRFSRDWSSDVCSSDLETASDRVGIGTLTARLAKEKIVIIGLGGTGSYILDFVAKTPVREIRLIDADEFLQHNAFQIGRASCRERGWIAVHAGALQREV